VFAAVHRVIHGNQRGASGHDGRGPHRPFSAFLVGLLAIGGGLAATAQVVHAAPIACDSASLVSAIAAANATVGGGTVTLPSGCTFTLATVNNETDGSNGLPDITNKVTINGNGATIARGSGAPDFRFFLVDEAAPGGDLTLNSLTLSNGAAELTQAHGGGAILNRNILSVNGVTFTNNVALDPNSTGGGAVDNHDKGQATIVGSTFTNNQGEEGGAAENEATLPNSFLTISQSTFENNSTTSYGGGGVENQPLGQATLTNDTFVSNDALEGGGVANGGTMTLSNSTLVNNTERGNGGGGIQNYGTLTIQQTTLSGNGGPGGGANLHTYVPAMTTVSTTVSQTIVANGATSANCSGTGVITDGGYNLDTGSSCGFSNVSLNNTDPQLQSLASNGGSTQTMALPSDSPAVDAIPATFAGCPGSTDQRGIARPQGAGCDIGAFEFTTADILPPSTPGGLTAQSVSSKSVTLNWNPSTDNVAVTGYTVYRNGTARTTTGASATTYTDQSVAPSTTYSYTVDAFDAAGNHSAQSSPLAVTTPAAPTTFTPHSVGAPSLALTPDGGSQLLFWRGAANHLFEAWYSGGSWYGPADLTASVFGGAAPLLSAPSARVTADGSTQLVFWQGASGHLFEAWYGAAAWHGPLDISAAYLGSAAPLTSAPSVAVTPDGSQQLVYWRGAGGHVDEAWYAGGRWNGPLDLTAGLFGGAAPLSSAPSATVTPDGDTQLLFWQGPAGHLVEAWFAAGSWHGPVDWTSAAFGGAAPLASAPSVTTTPTGDQQLVYWQSPSGHLDEAWWAGGRWNGPLDLSAAFFGGTGTLTSAPSAAVAPDGSAQLVFWQGAGQTLWEAWFTGRWNGPQDLSAG
jgi:Fibronectin type III domain